MELEERFDLVSRLLSSQAQKNESLEEFRKMVDHDYIEFTKKDDALAEEASNLKALQGIVSDLEIFIRYEQIYRKNIIALGGGFSSGKSAFGNSVLETKDVKLPVGVQPVTAIPAYVISGETSNAFGITNNGGVVDLGVDMYKSMDHDFLQSFQFNLKDLLPSVIINTKLPEQFNHICFIDTPGYNPGDAENAFTGGDRATSLEFIRQAKGLFWFIGLDTTGTLTDSDIEFLEDVFKDDPGKKLYVVCNKADLKADSDIEDILDEVADVLDDNDLPYEGIVAYSARKKQSYGYRKMTLEDFIESQNRINSDKKRDLQKRLKDVFQKHLNADNDKKNEILGKLKRLNRILLHFHSVVDEMEMKINDEQTKKRREAIIKGAKFERGNENEDQSVSTEFIVKEIASLKNDLERNKQKYQDNLEEAQDLSDKMFAIIGRIFTGFDDVPEDDSFMLIPKQTFAMGSSDARDEGPIRQVSLDAFYMKTTLVTQEEWKTVLGTDRVPSYFKGEKLPVENVSFLDAVDFCNAWSVKENLIPCYTKEKSKIVCDFSASGYRLPTEAEWECAAKLGETSDLEYTAWYKDNSNEQTQNVGMKEPNAYGLYDMQGNVSEWCYDFYAPYSENSTVNPTGPNTGDERVTRGGSWNSPAKRCGVTVRNFEDESTGSKYIGFRVVRKK